MHHSRVNPPGQVERTGLVVALVLATAPASRQGLRMHHSRVNPADKVKRTGLVVALVLATARLLLVVSRYLRHR